MHRQFPEFFVVGTVFPAVFVHFLAEIVERIGIERARVGSNELAPLFLGQFHDFGSQFAGHLSALSENHSPDGVVHHHVASLALFEREQVEERDVLHVLRERRHQRWIAHARPHVFHLVEEFHEHVVGRKFGLALLLSLLVDDAHDAAEVRHHRAHHATRQSAAEQERRHVLVARIDEVAEPVVDEFLRERAGFHVGVHVDVGHVESLVSQHRLHADDVGMHLSPRKRLDGRVDDVGAVFADFENRCHRQSGTRVAVILDDDVGIFRLDHLRELAQKCRLTDARHVFQADFLGSGGNHLVGNRHVVVERVDGRCRDAERGLRRHSGLFRPANRGNDVARVVKSVENTRNIHALRVFHLVHQRPDVVGHGIHAQRIQAAVEHVGLDAHLVERLAEGSHGVVRILASQQVHLLEGSAIGFHTGKAAHLDNHRSNALQLVFPWLELA